MFQKRQKFVSVKYKTIDGKVLFCQSANAQIRLRTSSKLMFLTLIGLDPIQNVFPYGFWDGLTVLEYF